MNTAGQTNRHGEVKRFIISLSYKML